MTRSFCPVDQSPRRGVAITTSIGTSDITLPQGCP